MSPEVVAKVFEPFFTTKGVGKGTGLGLSQVYRMAQQSHGAVSIQSVLGQGTSVEIWLPLCDEQDEDEPIAPSERDSLRGLKVLVVEDDDAVRSGLVDALFALGCNVSQASSGEAGLSALRGSWPGLLLTDFLMPDMTGVDLALQARSIYPDLPILVATGYADMDAIEEAVGQDAILRKPFPLAELGAALARVTRAGGSTKA